jgi:PAS domain S-box-containing protein
VLILVTTLAVVFAAVLGVLVVRSITRPLVRAVAVAEAVAGGKLDKAIESGGKDETAQLLGALANMQTSLLEREVRDAEYRRQIAAIGKAQALIEFKLDASVVHANDNFCHTLGYTLDEIKGRHHSLFAEPSYAASAEYRQFWEKLNRGEYDAAQYKRIGKGGKEVWIQASYNPILDVSGKPFKVVKFATDISEQIMAAAAMKEAVEQTQDVALAAKEGDLSRRVPLEGKAGTIKSLAEGINGVMQTTEVAINDVVRVLGALAKGDLTEKIDADYHGTFGKLKDEPRRRLNPLPVPRRVRRLRTALKTGRNSNKNYCLKSNTYILRSIPHASLIETLDSRAKIFDFRCVGHYFGCRATDDVHPVKSGSHRGRHVGAVRHRAGKKTAAGHPAYAAASWIVRECPWRKRGDGSTTRGEADRGGERAQGFRRNRRRHRQHPIHRRVERCRAQLASARAGRRRANDHRQGE